MAPLKDYYRKNVLPQLVEKLELKNPWAAPRVKKVVLNIGLGEAVEEKGVVEKAADVLTVIAGQKPKVAQARRAISAFKLREGMPIGLMVTLRGERMYQFLDKLIRIVLPRLRDFQGVSPDSFDGRGNYNLGLREQLVFPEVDYEKIDKVRGLQVTIVTTAKDNESARLMLGLLGLPFSKKEK
ncbi:50S ribosomal protein L5 [Patescibacteria group bacterium]|nr:50S ribosomal protein L5 [Patescibacteria group bacterium]